MRILSEKRSVSNGTCCIYAEQEVRMGCPHVCGDDHRAERLARDHAQASEAASSRAHEVVS